ncbi:hypothetical protein [Natronobacterium gregoryi]|uniref:TRAM domain-containing protein n=2 Tax=Natronobacterium gregoryi TaxID=44930 RepID=L0AJK0_NATGS|nr:hypothetical protein [Natronobacterium gregoryi]AFZ73991.1 hypothetical protein Natgr_2847 [Natronobacterium gregoryi SP2]ELY68805.1 hypothetical protein C490_08971 [Natronobacterium gregoryi SP2]PLK18244.1 hypothetical protein CYV19_18465 [Natronobacterium gregoryi SP2]SFJ73365.1 hypothetical protein SAMN05443661_1688 [Natronobacterium gregoryi]
MTSIRDLLGESLGVGETFRLHLEERDGRLVADHPNEASPVAVAVVEGVDQLEERPPDEPVAVEIVDRIADGRVVGRVLEVDGASEPGTK